MQGEAVCSVIAGICWSPMAARSASLCYTSSRACLLQHGRVQGNASVSKDDSSASKRLRTKTLIVGSLSACLFRRDERPRFSLLSSYVATGRNGFPAENRYRRAVDGGIHRQAVLTPLAGKHVGGAAS